MKVNKLIGKGMIALAACFMAMPVQALTCTEIG